MKLFHTADWHLGKLIQGVYMTEDQRYILEQFLQAIREEQPDVVMIAGDLYDRAVPPTDAVALLDEVLQTIIIDLHIPVLAIAGNHDSPGRLHFGSQIMKSNGLYMMGHPDRALTPIILNDEHGEVHFHLLPYVDPSVVRHMFQQDDIKTHHDSMKALIEKIKLNMSEDARHVCISHSFVTPMGEPKENTSDSERPLSIGGAEHVDARLFDCFHYTALGHLHQAHHVGDETIRYSGSPMKYSISEENHNKGFLMVELDDKGNIMVEKKLLKPKRDMRTVEASISELLSHPMNDDFVFVKLLDEAPVLSPMEKIRSVYPNAMHVERKFVAARMENEKTQPERRKMDDLSLFKAFYQEVQGEEVPIDMQNTFKEILDDVLKEERERE